MKLVGWIALYFMVFEVAQLIMAQRYIGIEQIRRNSHPLDGLTPRSFWFSAGWITVLMADYCFQSTLLAMPIPPNLTDWPGFLRMAAFFMLLVSFVGFVVRRRAGLKWGLVVLTLEGAIRAGLFLFVFSIVVMNGALTPFIKYTRGG
jgi:hypothetical protein